MRNRNSSRFYKERERVLSKIRTSTLLPKGAGITFVKRKVVLSVPGKKDVELSYTDMIEFLDDWYTI